MQKALLQVAVLPQHFDCQKLHEAFQLQSLGNPSSQALAKLEFLSKGRAEARRVPQRRRDLQAQALVECDDMMRSDDFLVLPHIFGDLGNSPCLFIDDDLVKEGKSVSYF